MPEQEPTPWELLRAVNRVEKLVVDLSTRLDRLVSLDLFAQHQREMDRRFADLNEDIVTVKAARRSDMQALTEQRRYDDEKRERQRLLVVGAIITAVASLASTLFLQIVGGRG